MTLNRVAINHRITVLVLLFLIVVMGIYSYLSLPREAAPEVVIPILNVVVTYQGVSPEDMESLVTIPIERKLTGISGVKKISSSSLEGVSSTTIEFTSDTDIDQARQKVRDKVDMAKQDLPEDADDPMISEFNISEMPIVYLSLQGDVGMAILHTVAKDMKDRIEAIKGVLSCDVIGDVTREIEIEVDPDRVAQYGISLVELATIPIVENVNTPGGTLDLGEAKFSMRVPGEFTSPNDLTDLVVRRGESGTVYLRDVATIKDTFKEQETYSRVDGKPAITLAVSKRAGENIIRVSDQVKAVASEFRAKLPQGIEIGVPSDQSSFTRDMVAELENSILSGLILVLAVMLASLGLTNSGFVAVAIPISMMITFTILNMVGVTLNFVVLFSLILVLGHLVDVSIVVVENTFRHRQQGMDRVEAAYVGASEVSWPIAGSTLTAVAAFFPLLFWPGIMGRFMAYLPMTVSIALLSTLFVGMVINPALNSMWMPAPKRTLSEGESRQHPILRAYESLLRLVLRWRGVTMVIFMAVLATITLVYLTQARIEFMPDTEPRLVMVDVDCPQGTNLDTSDRFVRMIEDRIRPTAEGADYIMASVGSRGIGGFMESGGSGTYQNRVTLVFPEIGECKVAPSIIMNQVRGLVGSDPGITVRIDKEQEGPPTGPPVNIEISGDDFRTLAALAQDIKRAIKDVPGLVDARDNYDRGKPEVRVTVDRQQATLAGLNTQFIGTTVNTAINGRKAGEYREGDEEYDVIVRFPKWFREDLANIGSMTLISLNGRPIPFSAVAKLEQGAGLGSIERINRKRTVTVSANVEGRLAPAVLADVRAFLDDYPLPPGYSLSYTGENEDMTESMAFLSRAFVIALFLITLVMVTEFNSIVQPLIIMTTVAMSVAGVLLALIVFHKPFNIIMTGIGCISLAGVVVNNGIVMLDFINRMRERGLPLNEAVVQAAVIRFRPVMLTAITTVIGLVPMAIGISFDFRKFKWIFGGFSSQWWGPMALAVTVGLTFATFLTLIAVPTIYSLTYSFLGLLGHDRAVERVPEAEVPAK